MQKNLRKVIIFGLLLILLFSLSGCGSETNEIRALTKDFENACNKLDMNEMLECIDPDISGSIKKLTGFIGMFSDKDTDELLDSFAKVLFSNLPENSREFFSSIKIKLDSITKEENKAHAAAEIEYEISGEDKKVNASFDYTYEDGKWYISKLDLE